MSATLFWPKNVRALSANHDYGEVVFDLEGPGSTPVPTPQATVPEAQPNTVDPPSVDAALVLENAALREQLAQMTTVAGRERADGMNIKRRAAAQVDDARRYAIEPAAGPLLSTLDTFDLALKHLPEELGVEHRRGLESVRAQLVRALSLVGIKPMDDVETPLVGTPFDPSVHNAIVSREGDVAEATVAEVIANGYMLHDRVIRAASVVVDLPA